MARTKRNNGDNGSPVSAFQHGGAARLNIPEATETQAGLSKGKKRIYHYSPHLSPKLQFDPTGASDQVPAIVEKVLAGKKLTDDEANILRTVARQGAQPWLEWAGKREQQAKGTFAVDDIVLHIHERISAQAILATARRQDVAEQDFFARPKLHQEQALQYYRHSVDWANRLILGDSLQVMSSLANRENLAGKVQMIYFDPPYGIKYSSNWQNELGKRDIKDKDEDLTREPEMIKAYRDTWQLGVHSYLAYLKQRLIVAKELLSDSGSIFVQIGEENLHRVRCVMEEVFGVNNFATEIAFVTTGGFSADGLSNPCNYLLWFAKSRRQMRFNRVYEMKPERIGESGYRWIALPTGEKRGLRSTEIEGIEKVPAGGMVYKPDNIKSSGASQTDQNFSYCGKQYHPGANNHWKTNVEGLTRLGKAGRIHIAENSMAYVRFPNDFPVKEIGSLWLDTATGNFTGEKLYSVQTNADVISRCIMMTTLPGELVLDPTCGSGTTAYAAER